RRQYHDNNRGAPPGGHTIERPTRQSPPPPARRRAADGADGWDGSWSGMGGPVEGLHVLKGRAIGYGRGRRDFRDPKNLTGQWVDQAEMELIGALGQTQWQLQCRQPFLQHQVVPAQLVELGLARPNLLGQFKNPI